MNKSILAMLLLAISIGACNPMPVQSQPVVLPNVENNSNPATLTVMTHDSFAASEEVIAQFEKTNNVKISFLKSGDTGAALNRAILTKPSPLADVFYGVDNTFLSRALEEDIFEMYASPVLQEIKSDFKLDPQNRALPVDYGDVCINIDKAYFKAKNLPVPQSLDDLLKPEYKGMLVMENPATSSPGLSFLLASISHFGEDKYLDFWKGMQVNDIVIVNDWETAYYTNFSGSSGRGPQPMVVSYSTSPAAEVIFGEDPKPAEAPTGLVSGKETCFRQIEFIGILKGTKQRALAEKFIDFMLGKTFQEDMPMQMFVFPVNSNAHLPAEFEEYGKLNGHLALMDADVISKNRESWIKAWKEIVLK